MKLTVENEQLRAGGTLSTNAGNSAATAKISQLENRLLAKQEELTELHKHKAENSQMIIDLGANLEKLKTAMKEREKTYDFF